MQFLIGEMRERLNRAVSKTVVPQGTGGSNPPLSVAKKSYRFFSLGVLLRKTPRWQWGGFEPERSLKNFKAIALP